MQIVKKAEELSRICREWHKAGETVSLVPTMGYYHAGHESLMDRARELGTKLVVSLSGSRFQNRGKAQCGRSLCSRALRNVRPGRFNVG